MRLSIQTMLGSWRSLIRKLDTQTVVAAAGASLLVIVSIAMAIVVIQLRTDALEEARRNIANLAFVLGEQTARSTQSIDLVLRDLQDTIRQTQGDSTENFEHVVTSEPFQLELKEKIARFPQADIFAIVDSQGHLASASRNAAIGLDLSARDYFQYLSANNDPNLFISVPAQNRTTGVWTIYFARRISSRSGEFLGDVVCGVPIRYFEDIYRSIDLPRKESFLLARRDGTVLVRHPDLTQRAGQLMPVASPWYKIVAEGGGYYESPGYFDATPRMVAVRPLLDFPLVVDASVDKREVLATWRWRAFYMITGTILMLAYAAFLMRVVHRQFTRLHDIGGSLRRQNDELTHLSQELGFSKAHLAKRTQELEMTLETMDQGLMMVDRLGVVVQCNTQAMRHLDLPADMMASRPQFSAVLEYQWNANRSGVEEGSFEEFTRKRMVDDRPYMQELKRPDGRVIEMRSIPMAAGGFVRTYLDITDRKVAEDRVHYLAHHDDLTRLINRVAFREHLQEAIAMARASGRGTALLYLDLDSFKQVNDTRGHEVGDRVLAEAALRMQAAVRANDTVARLGGDEFAIILPSLDDRGTAENLAKRLVSELARPFEINNTQSSIGVSIGIAIHPEDGLTADELLCHADGALYDAKHAGRNTFCFHRASESSGHAFA
jgi:diguanylate cyclase (GGDEF)-like protein